MGINRTKLASLFVQFFRDKKQYTNYKLSSLPEVNKSILENWYCGKTKNSASNYI